jgi:hypothetical protein
VAGQSNATGLQSYAIDPVTKVNYFASPYTNGADVLDTLSLYGASPTLTRVPLDTPQRISGSGPAVFGPEIELARTIYADTGQSVSIVKASIPGSSLAVDWRGPEYVDAMLDLVRNTINADARAGYADTVAALYWYQGESDAMVPAWAVAYRRNLEIFIAGLRSRPLLASVPVVLVKESVICPLCVGNTQVRRADDWVAAHRAHVVTVDTADLTRIDGWVHLSNVSELALGRRLALESENLLGLTPASGTTSN